MVELDCLNRYCRGQIILQPHGTWVCDLCSEVFSNDQVRDYMAAEPADDEDDDFDAWQAQQDWVNGIVSHKGGGSKSGKKKKPRKKLRRLDPLW